MIIKMVSQAMEMIAGMTSQDRNVKHFGNNNNDNNNSASSTSTTIADNTVTNITECLTEDHQQCTGKYVDSITGGFTIICFCKCHHNNKGVK